ncbi:hypothetical protein [Moraxella oblonga]|nr:hypothetical protein [Moraxella oblonga]
MIITSKDNPLIKTAHALLTDLKKYKKISHNRQRSDKFSLEREIQMN